ncbi:MAG: ABC transporter permease [Blastocatellales bacterium]|nr:ABC transporter permease [Blastocatellales bacterium]
MQTFRRNLRYSARVLARRPVFTIVAVATLALGIGATTAIFSVVDAVLLRSLPYPDSDRIVQLREINERGIRIPVAEPNYADVREKQRSFDALAQYSGGLSTVLGGSEPVRTRVMVVSAEFFQVFGATPLAGRLWTAEEILRDRQPVAAVSYAFWQRQFGGRSDFSSTPLRINDDSYTISAVMPAGFAFPASADVWTPRELRPPQTSRTAHNWSVVGRVRSGVSLEQASAEVSAIGRSLRAEHGQEVDAVDMALVPLQEFMVGSAREGLYLILAAVGALMLIACANVANLSLAQAAARSREYAVRSALGATRWHLAQQSVAENLLLAGAAGALGVIIAFWGVDALLALDARGLPRTSEIGVNARVLLFTTALSIAVAAVLGLAPLLRISVNHLAIDLKDSARGAAGARGGRGLRALLVVAQVAMTMVLLAGAGLLGRSFLGLLQIDPGFRTENIIAMETALPWTRDEQRMAKVKSLQQELRERIAALPGVLAVGSANSLPMTGGGSNGQFLVNNDPAQTGYAEYRLVSGGYFTALGIPLLRGRLFGPTDAPTDEPKAVISRSLADKQWPNEDPIGKRLQYGNMDGDMRLIEIVGIVGDVREYGLEAAVRPVVYANDAQRPASGNFSLVVKTHAGAAAITPVLRATLAALDPEVPASFRSVEQIFSASLGQRRFQLVLVGVFAAAALLLAAAGIYSVISYAVAQRTHEIGVRIALGAQRRDVMRLVFGEGLTLIGAGITVGLLGAAGLTRMIEGMLYGVSPLDPATFAGVVTLLVIIALAACYIPAQRATRVDPITALRED